MSPGFVKFLAGLAVVAVLVLFALPLIAQLVAVQP